MTFTPTQMEAIQNKIMDYSRQEQDAHNCTNQMEDYTTALVKMVWDSMKEHNEKFEPSFFTVSQMDGLTIQMMDYSRNEQIAHGCTNRLGNYTLTLVDMVWRLVKEHNEKVGGWHVDETIGRAWISSEERRNDTDCRCQCVIDGQVELVVSDHPDDLAQEHRNGDWCPCEGQQKKWIYLHEPSGNSWDAEEEDEPCVGCEEGYGQYHIAHFDMDQKGRRTKCRFVDDVDEMPLWLPMPKSSKHDCPGCQAECNSEDRRHFEPTYEECGWQRMKVCSAS